MGAQFTIDVSRRLVISTFTGENTVEEIVGLAARIRSHPDFDPSFSEIVDCSAIFTYKISTTEIKQMARRQNIFNPTSMHVIIAPQDNIYGLARMGQVFAEQTVPNLVVVRTVEEARKVLQQRSAAAD